MPSPISFSRPARFLATMTGDLVEILLIVQIALHQHVLGLLDEIGNGVAYIALAFFIVRISLAAASAAGEAGLSGVAAARAHSSAAPRPERRSGPAPCKAGRRQNP
jgi:hypothetical protein